MLNQYTPEEGQDIQEYLARKYGSRAVQRMNDPNSYLYTAGKKVGIEFLKKRNIYPTFKAHSLMEFVKEIDNNLANDLMEQLFHRYFEKGENINEDKVLVEIASNLGIDQGKARKSLEGDNSFRYTVQEKDQIHKQRMRISGVPFFIIERKGKKPPLGFSGAQPIEIMAEQLEEATEE